MPARPPLLIALTLLFGVLPTLAEEIDGVAAGTTASPATPASEAKADGSTAPPTAAPETPAPAKKKKKTLPATEDKYGAKLDGTSLHAQEVSKKEYWRTWDIRDVTEASHDCHDTFQTAKKWVHGPSTESWLVFAPRICKQGFEAEERKAAGHDTTEFDKMWPWRAVCILSVPKSVESHVPQSCYDTVIATLSKVMEDPFNKLAVLRGNCRKDREFCERTTAAAESVPDSAKDDASVGARILSCVRTRPESSDKCKKAIQQVDSWASLNFKLFSPYAAKMCEAEVSEHCNTGQEHLHIRHEPGVVRVCLRRHYKKLGSNCLYGVMQDEVDRAHDPHTMDVQIRLHCARERKEICGRTGGGYGKVTICLWRALHQGTSKDSFSVPCAEAVRQSLYRMQHSLRLNPLLQSACKETAQDECGFVARHDRADLKWKEKVSAEEVMEKDRDVMLCLKKKFMTKKLPQRCEDMLRANLMLSSLDFKADSSYPGCTEDIQTYCPNVPSEGGKMLDCLRENLDALRDDCKRNQFALAKIEEGDNSFKVAIKKACTLEIDRLCPEQDQFLPCLHDQLERIKDHHCLRVVQRDAELTGQDYRLKYQVSLKCEADINKVCKAAKAFVDKGQFAPMGTEGVQSGYVLHCLAKNTKLLEDDCREEVKRVLRLGAFSYMANPGVRDSCEFDVGAVCYGVEPGHGRVHACLLKHFEKLTPQCAKAEIMLQTSVRVGQNHGLEGACRAVMPTCEDAVDLPQCLQKQKGNRLMSKMCKVALTNEVRLRHIDYRISPSVLEWCKGPIEKRCKTEKETHEQGDHDGVQRFGAQGGVISCLILQRHTLPSGCKDEVTKLLQQRQQNLLLDPRRKAACQADIRRFCPSVESGQGRINACLRSSVKSLEAQCKAVVEKHATVSKEASVFSPSFVDNCEKYSQLLCKNSEEEDAFFCLVQKQDDPRVPQSCQQAIKLRTTQLLDDFDGNPNLARQCGEQVKERHTNKRCPAGDRGKFGCLFDALIQQDQLDDACAHAAMRVATLVTSAPLDFPAIQRRCRGPIGTCQQDCGFEPALGVQAHQAQPFDAGRRTCVWKCLRKRVVGTVSASEQSGTCAATVRRVLKLESFDIRLNPAAAKACVAEVTTVCDRKPGGMRVLACLKALGDKASPRCIDQVNKLRPGPDQAVQFGQLVYLETARPFGPGSRGILDLVELRGPLAVLGCASLFLVGAASAYYGFYRYNRRGYTVFVAKD